MNDPGELFRFWLMHRYHEQGFSVPKLAASLKLQPVTVGHWLRRRSAIHTAYWPGIAAFFGKDHPEEMVIEARRLWAQTDNRRYYVRPMADRRSATSTAADTARVHAETPGAAAAIADSLDGARTPRRPRQSGHRPTTRRTRVSSKSDGFDRLITKRFPRHTTAADMKAWRREERDRLRQRLEAHRQKRAATHGTPDTFRADASRYLEAVRELTTYAERCRDIGLWVAIFGDRPRSTIGELYT